MEAWRRSSVRFVSQACTHTSARTTQALGTDFALSRHRIRLVHRVRQDPHATMLVCFLPCLRVLGYGVLWYRVLV